MICLYVPQYKDLWFRKMILSDENTMSYNHAWGGVISWDEDEWPDWYDYWVINNKGERFYRYLQNVETREFVGEIAYHFNGNECMADVIIYSKFRGKGYGKEGLRLLCESAKCAGVKDIYDDIAIDNPAVSMFLKMGFVEEYRNNDIIMLKKTLI